jgi:hypothetical protein
MRWRLYSGIAAVFTLGGVAGGLLGVTAERDRMRRMEKEGPTLVLESLVKKLEDELKLNPAQVRRVKEVYAGTRPQLLQMERERRRRLRQLMETTHPPILEVLAPAQRERYQQLQQKLQLRLRLREPGKPGDPGPGPAPALPVAPPT